SRPLADRVCHRCDSSRATRGRAALAARLLPDADRANALVALRKQPGARPRHPRRIVSVRDVDLGRRALLPPGEPDAARGRVELAVDQHRPTVAAVVSPVVDDIAERIASLAD